MPSRTLTPAPPAASAHDEPPAPTLESPSSPGPTVQTTPTARTTPITPAGSAGLAAPAGSAAWFGLRLVKVPAGWPPYDCETHGAACPAARSAAAAAAAAAAAGSAPAADSIATGRPIGTPSSVATAARPAAGQDPDRSAGTAPGDAVARADVAVRAEPADRGAEWPVRLAQVIVEVLAGSRSRRQLVPCTTERVREQVNRLGQALSSDQRPRIRRIMTSRPAAHVVEMTVVVSFGPRSRALAMRFEHMPARQPGPGRPARPARWLCTEIETG